MGTHAVPRQSAERLPLYVVLRAHGMRELKGLDAATLRQYQDIVLDKIVRHEETLRSNIQRGFAAEIRQDVRWFQAIHDEISTLLMGEFTCK